MVSEWVKKHTVNKRILLCQGDGREDSDWEGGVVCGISKVASSR